MDAFYQIPSLILLGTLVLIFGSVRQQNRTIRFRLWLYAWVMIFIRLALSLFFHGANGRHPGLEGLDLSLIQCAALIFMISVSTIADRPVARYALFFALAIPSVAYAFIFAYHPGGHWLSAPLLGLIFAIGILFAFWHHGVTAWSVAESVFVTLVLGWAAFEAAFGKPLLGYLAELSAAFLLTAALFLRAYRRLSPGVVASVLGFIGWAFAAIVAMDPARMAGSMEFWNVPKFIIAIGMIVTLLEEERFSADASRMAQWSINEQLRRFSDITYRLLGGWPVKDNAAEVAQVIAASANFDRVCVVLADDQRRLYLAGHHGYKDPEDIRQIEQAVERMSPEMVAAICSQGRAVGRHSYRVSMDDLVPLGCTISGRDYPLNPFWKTGDHLIVPLLPPQKNYVGFIALQDARQADRVNATELSPLEMLCADIAVAIENAMLQQHLFRSEKLAGMGQLVAGVAHELNNPLTAVVGYTEMLKDRSPDEATTHDLSVIRRESLRMKNIIDKLQRFARQQRVENRAVDLAPLVDEVLKLKRLDLHQRGVRVTTELNGIHAAADDVMLKQVLLNVLGNAIDAVSDVPERHIEISAAVNDGKAQLSVRDTGAGFKDASRAFDPFYTTKAPGQGTGLGLSICYALVKDMGGDIFAANASPKGAQITIELPESVMVAGADPSLA